MAMNMERRLVMVVARRELAEAVRTRWFWSYTACFIVVASALTFLGSFRSPGAFGRSAASLVALTQILVPLTALTLGAISLAGGKERGALRFLMSHPINRAEALTGIVMGVFLALTGAVGAGFGVAALGGYLFGSSGNPAILLGLAALTLALVGAMLMLGVLIGAASRRPATALAGAVFSWLTLVFLGDLGVMGTALATDLPVEALLLAVMINPVEAYRIAAVPIYGASLDVLGPAGSYVIDTLGSYASLLTAGVLVAWIVVPTWLAARLFARSDL
jgi:Cu-processing system permease protein